MSRDPKSGSAGGAQLREPPKPETKDAAPSAAPAAGAAASASGAPAADSATASAAAAAPAPAAATPKDAPKEAPKEPPKEAPKSAPKERAISHHVIAPRKSLTSLRGMLKEGDRVTARDFPGGQASFDEHVAAERIIPVLEK